MNSVECVLAAIVQSPTGFSAIDEKLTSKANKTFFVKRRAPSEARERMSSVGREREKQGA